MAEYTGNPQPVPPGDGWEQCSECAGCGWTERDVRNVAQVGPCIDCDTLGWIREPDDITTETA